MEDKKKNMQEVYDFLKECGVYFLSTSVDGQPYVRPFGLIEIINDRLYTLTGKVKDVYKQLEQNPKFELVAIKRDNSQWVRVSGLLVDDPDLEPQRVCLSRNPHLAKRYQPGDGNTAMLYIQDGLARFFSFTSDGERQIHF